MEASTTSQQIEDRIVATLADFGAARDDITPDATFEALDIDSLDLVELAQVVEAEFSVEIGQDDMPKIKTVGDAIDYVVTRAR